MEFVFPTEDIFILLNVAVACALGAIIGLEREWSKKPAGLRTHMFVSGAAALLLSLGLAIVEEAATEAERGVIRSDPIRVIEAIVTGISFLGAGMILYRAPEDRIAGLTTAASLLFTSGVGVATALGKYTLAVGLAIVAVGILRGVTQVERILEVRSSRKNFSG